MTGTVVRRTGDPSDEGRHGTYAGIVSRGVSFTVDALVVAAMLSVTATVVGAVAATLRVDNDTLSRLEGLALVGATTLTVVFFYNTLALWLFGRTAGMLVMGLRVVRADGRNPGLVRAAVRTVATVLSTVFMLGFAWIAIDNRRQAWHDKIAGTFVVYDWRARSAGLSMGPRTEPLVPHS